MRHYDKCLDLGQPFSVTQYASTLDAVLVTEMTRWGRSTQDLMSTLGELASWDASLMAQTGLTFDLSTPQGRLVASLMASLAEFEHELLRERVKSGIAAAKARGQTFGRPPGPRPSDRHAPEVLRLTDEEGLSQRAIAARLGISKTTVNAILSRRAETEKRSAEDGSTEERADGVAPRRAGGS
ncbi:MAG: recombinase family protein [Actinomycetota bacterium]|nr:recombinase family protein [Actinomycetota bacterium]